MTVDASAWVPDRQLDNVASLGFVNHLLGEVHDTYFAYVDGLGDGPIKMMRTSDKEREFVTVKAIVPVPTLLRGRVAKAIEELRAVLEHVLMSEVEAALGRSMTSKEQLAVEMPHRDSHAKLVAWSADKRRSTLSPIHAEGDLFDRLDALQPYNRAARPELHPLSLIAEFSNETKHRRPLRIAVLPGHIHAEGADTQFEPGVQLASPLQPGDVLGSVPLGVKALISVFPSVCIWLPETGEWRNLISTLRDLEAWVRTVAVPTLITGSHRNLPTINAGIDVIGGYDDLRVAIAGAAPVSATETGAERIMLETMKRDLPYLLAALPGRPGPDVIWAFVESLDDERIRDITLTFVSLRDGLPALGAFCAQLELEMRTLVPTK